MIQLKRQIRMYKDELWNIIVVKTPYGEKLAGHDGFYEFWLNNDEYGHMMYLKGEGLKNWNEAKEYTDYFMTMESLENYAKEVEKLETDNNTSYSSFSCPLIDKIIPLSMKGVNDGNEKKYEETQRQKSVHTNSKQCKKN